MVIRSMLVVGAILLAAMAGAATNTSSVIVSDSSLTPANVAIAPGDSVEWRNGGKLSHRIVSAKSTWPPFTLTPGETRTISFPSAGYYLYRVEGGRKGLVTVGTAETTVDTKPKSVGTGVKWDGAMSSYTKRDYPSGTGSCSAEWDTWFTFTVAPNGSLSGSGTAEIWDKPTCTKITNHPAVQTISVLVSGSADSTSLLLQFREVSHSPGLPAALWAGFLSVFMKDVQTPMISPMLVIPKQDACHAFTEDFTTALAVGPADHLTSVNQVNASCHGSEPK
jgi:plastocyanin